MFLLILHIIVKIDVIILNTGIPVLGIKMHNLIIIYKNSLPLIFNAKWA